MVLYLGANETAVVGSSGGGGGGGRNSSSSVSLSTPGGRAKEGGRASEGRVPVVIHHGASKDVAGRSRCLFYQRQAVADWQAVLAVVGCEDDSACCKRNERERERWGEKEYRVREYECEGDTQTKNNKK
jgi:hypothetical protein